MKNIMLALRQIAEENPEVELVYPGHLSPVVREAVDTDVYKRQIRWIRPSRSGSLRIWNTPCRASL